MPKTVSCSLCFSQLLFIPPETVGSIPGSLLQSLPAPATVSCLMLTWSLLNPKHWCLSLNSGLSSVSPVKCTAGQYYLSNTCNKKSPKRRQHHKHGSWGESWQTACSKLSLKVAMSLILLTLKKKEKNMNINMIILSRDLLLWAHSYENRWNQICRCILMV